MGPRSRRGHRHRRHGAPGRDADRADGSPPGPVGGAPATRPPEARVGRPPGSARARPGSDRHAAAAVSTRSSGRQVWPARRHDRRRPHGGRAEGPAVPGSGRPGRGPRFALGDALDLRAAAGAGRLPVGPRADPRLAPQPSPRGGVRGLRRARGRRDPRAGRGAGRPAAPGRAARAAGGRAGRVRHDRRVVGHRVQDRPPPSPRVRRCRGAHRLGREPPVGAHQGG